MGEPRRASKTEQAHLVVVDGRGSGIGHGMTLLTRLALASNLWYYVAKDRSE